MGKKWPAVVAAVLLCGLLAVGGYARLAGAAVGGEPGSDADPLVSKSFVEEYVAKYVREALGERQGGGDFQWRVATVPAGQEFTGGAGMEFILRSGKAVAVDPTGSGIPDVTSGTNLTAGKAVAPNHLYIIPRADGRGLRAQTSVIIMYRGAAGK
ncbi:hypothetical protein [Desulfofundulus salinus]|uniref:Uncharacterized protein n=1 Tax=Desulfofundulus salinus TaxID=2419843 RepID=A0A494WS59_9FIRM|nr:hypothetical protein [Desulfofundulus salinum]RKO65661.1 hypothetical protein D7024_00875 [Desulfofundulus salinum]